MYVVLVIVSVAFVGYSGFLHVALLLLFIRVAFIFLGSLAKCMVSLYMYQGAVVV